ncbi:ABC transporter substrate-binding protein [Streptomyces sp. GESEQ-35]|uniref:ABC transporter substrate-binding protein n=1 Tax=Streptomyces sp. GESEQ-35 TaxID=2812657 RepID=UPI001B334AAE|nr:ABC transporter substrate-binding protein [Streptomyces sp. GESEQ-35]
MHRSNGASSSLRTYAPRRRTGGIAVVVGLTAAVGCSASAAPGAGEAITVSVSIAAPANAPIFLADELGYFKDEGLDVKVETIANASLQIATGKVQYGAVNTSTVIQAATQDIDLQQICVTQVDPSYMLAVSNQAWDRNDMSESMSLKEQLTALKGENITAIGGRTVNPGAKLLESLLEKEGLPRDWIGVLSQANTAASTAAFQKGQVGLVFQPQPIPDQVLSVAPGKIIYDTGSSDLFAELDSVAWSGVGASRSYAADHPDVSEKICNAVGKANNYLDEHPEDAAKALHQSMNSFGEDVLVDSMGSYKWAKDADMTEEQFTKSVEVLAGLGMFEEPSADVLEDAYTADYQK